MLYQYGNEANPRAHYETTGPEILRDLPEIDVFVAGLGTGGTLTGTGRYLKEQQARRQGRSPRRRTPATCVQGLRSLEEGFIPPVLDQSLLDGRIVVDSRELLRRRPRSCWRRRASSPASPPAPSCATAQKSRPALRARQHRPAARGRRLEVPLDQPLDARLPDLPEDIDAQGLVVM